MRTLSIFKGSRGQGLKRKAWKLKPLNPGILEPYFFNVEVDYKPSSVSPLLGEDNDHSSKDRDCSRPQATNPRVRGGPPLSPSYLVLLRMGFTRLPQSPGIPVGSYPAISPLPRLRRGGIFSVALSFSSPRLDVTQHPALWSSDFPPAGFGERSFNPLPLLKINPYFPPAAGSRKD